MQSDFHTCLVCNSIFDCGEQAYFGAYKVQREFLKEQSNLEVEAASKRDLQRRIDEQDTAAELLVRECSSLEQVSIEWLPLTDTTFPRPRSVS